MIRSPLTRKTPLRRVSAKRKAQHLDYEMAKAVAWERDGGRCQSPLGVHRGQIDAHHIRLQSRRPDLRCDPDNILLLCRACHDFAHGNPAWAKAQGLIK